MADCRNADTYEDTTPRKSVSDADKSVLPAVTEEGKVAAAEITCKENNWKCKPRDAKQGRGLRERSGKEAGIKSPEIVERREEITNNVVCRDKDIVVRYVTPEENPYDKAMSYLHKHSLPSLFQYITINLAYQRPEDPIDFMIDEVKERSREQYEEAKI